MEVEEGEDVEEVEDEDSAAAESRLARNVANFGMAPGGYYTPGRMLSEDKARPPSRAKIIEKECLAVGKVYPAIDDSIRKFIEAQPVFFVASAPLASDGHVNVSPKGMNTLRILGPTTVAYLDLTGSGIETVSHLKENGRIVLMFCAFQGPPKIVRLHGTGRVVEPGAPDFADLLGHFPKFDGTRTIVVIEVSRISDSCGFSVPLLEFKGERNQLSAWAQKLGEEGLKLYREQKNSRNIDGRPGLDRPV
jgi:hypothetical protein